jgi:tetratricopeptide (TPR) repeat protein
VPVAGAANTPAVLAPRRSGAGRLARRIAWGVALLWMVSFVLTEAGAWIAAGRFGNRIDAIEGRNLADARRDYDRIAELGPLDSGLNLRVNGPLAERLEQLGDSVIADYRREEPVMGPAEWRQAQDALAWATSLTPSDRRLRAKLLTAEGHVVRLSARGQPQAAARVTYRRALERFRAAAEMDERAFDPYLGISRIEVYALGDVDRGIAAVEAAEQRGYVAGRPERALLGDGYLKRAQASRALARTLSGEQRRRELDKARTDFTSCIAAFDPIVGFARAAENLEMCKRQLQLVEHEIAMLDGAYAQES